MSRRERSASSATEPTPREGSESDPSLSGLQRFILANTKSPAKDARNDPTTTLALQVAHNLRFQHNWSDIRIHFNTQDRTYVLPRPILSGLPPQRLYVHPDEQIDILNRQREQGKAGWPDVSSEREWVLPSHLRETWTLRRFAEVFDALGQTPEANEGGPLSFVGVGEQAPPFGSAPATPATATPRHSGAAHSDSPTASPPTSTNATSNADGTTSTANGVSPWRTKQPKRILLATLDDDSTVVYYIIHDGIVKPRQN